MLKQEIIENLVKEENGYIIFEYEPLGIVIYGKTKEEVIKAFNEELVMIFREYGQEKDENLTKDAIELKRKVNRLINKGDNSIT